VSLVRAAGFCAGNSSPGHSSIHISCRRDEQTPATAAADLTALASRVAGFVGRPFVRGAFFVRGATALAGDLTLLFGRHRSKTTPFLANSVHSILLATRNQ
jgi:hypothetical protein